MKGDKVVVVTYTSFVPVKVSVRPNTSHQEFSIIEVYGPPLQEGVKLSKLSEAMEEGDIYLTLRDPIKLLSMEIDGSMSPEEVYAIMSQEKMAYIYAGLWRRISTSFKELMGHIGTYL